MDLNKALLGKWAWGFPLEEGNRLKIRVARAGWRSRSRALLVCGGGGVGVGGSIL